MAKTTKYQMTDKERKALAEEFASGKIKTTGELIDAAYAAGVEKAALVCVARCESLTQVSAINEAMKCATAIRMACHADYMGANDEAHRKDAAGGLSGGADCSAAT